MMNLPARAFSGFLVLVISAAQFVCACPAPLDPDNSRPIPAACDGDRDCCRDENGSSTPAPLGDDPCDQCNLVHPDDKLLPAYQKAPPAHDLTFALPPIAVSVATPSNFLFHRHPCRSECPAPPLLQDLFHSGTLLLI